MSVTDHYGYRVHWSADDASYVGTVAELPSLSRVSADRAEAFEGIQRLGAEVVADMVETGEVAPEAIGDRSYSGKFMVRILPEMHRRLALEAAEQNVSLNRLVSMRLAG